MKRCAQVFTAATFYRCLRNSITILLLSLALSGCATTFKENHYFQLKDPETGKVSNYYRLTVSGGASFSSARYISGFYDERAIDLFFNEVKTTTTPDTCADPACSGKLFIDNVTDPGGTSKITPLSPDGTHGAFLMIFSTNASSVTKVIGQFAENQLAADAITNLANRDTVLHVQSEAQANIDGANATQGELDKLMSLLPAGDHPDSAETVGKLLRILGVIASDVDGRQLSFPVTTGFDPAQRWYESASVRRSTQ